MSYTQAQLRERVLQNMGVLAAGEAATGDDANLVDTIIANRHAQLRGLGLGEFELATIPEWAFEPLVLYVMASAGPPFGRPVAPELEQLGLGGLREQLQVRTNGRRVKAKYY